MSAAPEVSQGSAIQAPRLNRSRWTEAVLVGIAFLVVAWFYLFTIRTSGDLREGADFDYYNPLVDGFRAGHLYLPLEPDPRLIALSDPYDPALNSELRLADASYYRGHFYLYFGVVPAVTAMLPYNVLTGRHMPEAVAVLIFCLMGVGAASGLWLAIRRRVFPESATWLAPTGVLLFGFGAHVLALARRPEMWELPIASSLAFTMLALWAAWWSITGRRPVLALAGAGLCLGLAVGSRPTALFTVGLLVPALWYLRRSRDDGTWLLAGMAAVIAMGTIGIGLAWYNYARFDSPFQFGQAYQLTGLKEGNVHHFQWRFFLHNLRLYFAWPVRWTMDWPFVASRPFPPGPTGYYGGEELYCLAMWAPVLWLSLGNLLEFAKRQTSAGFGPMIVSVLAVYAPLQLFMLLFFSAAERYMVEFVPPLMLLALLGLLNLELTATKLRWRRAYATFVGVASVITITIGLLASFDYHGRNMSRTAPAVWRQMASVTEPIVRWASELVQPASTRRDQAQTTGRGK